MKRQHIYKQELQNIKQYHKNEKKQLFQPCYIKNKQNMDLLTDKKIDGIKKKYDVLYNKKYLLNHLNYQKSKQYPLQNKNNSSILSQKKQINYLYQQNLSHKQYLIPNYYKKNQKQNLQISQNFIQYPQYYQKQNLSHLQSFHTNQSNKFYQPQFNQFHQNQSRNIDPRLNNIDKINMKIKKFLNSLESNQKTKENSINVIPNSSLKSQNNLSIQKKPHKSQQLTRDEYSQQKKISKQSKKLKKQKILQQQIKQKKRNKNIIYKKQQKKQQKKQYKYINKCISKINIQKTNKNKKIQINKLNNQINKINQRIKLYQQQKKLLNIQFIPYHYQQKNYKIYQQNSISNNIQPSHKTNNQSISCTPTYQKQQINNQSLQIKQNQSQQNCTMDKNINYSYQMPLNSINSFTFKTDSLDNIKFDQKSQQFCIPQFSQKSQKSQSQCQQILQLNNQDISSDKIQQQQIKQKQNQNQLLSTVTITFSKQTKLLISNLFQQVKLDENLRNAKIWYNQLQNSNKLQQINKQASSLGITISQLQLKVTEQQDNPFYSPSQIEQNYQNLLNCLTKSNTYWQQNITHQFNIQQLQQEQFTCEKIDLQKKGYLLVEDLVRFLNMQTGTFYRNRDLILIFRRLSKGGQLKWMEFLQILNKNI